MIRCRCRDESVRFLSTECPEHVADSHTEWNRRWIAAHPGYRVRQAPRYPPGTFEVEHRCRCRGSSRYYAVRCPGVATHGQGPEPVFVDPIMVNAAEYHALIMSEVETRNGIG